MDRTLWRASKIGQYALCPGSLASSPEAESGTRCHAAMAIVIDGRGQHLSSLVKDITDEEIALARAAADTFGSAVKEYFGEAQTEISTETALELTAVGGVLITGTLDALARTQARALIYDAKFGHKELGTLAAWQGRAYAAMVAAKYGCHNVRVLFFSARDGTAYTKDYEFLGSPCETLDRIRDDIDCIWRNTQSECMRLYPGEEQCQYCAGKGICPAVRQTALATTEKLALLDLSGMPSVKLAQAYSMKSVFEEVFSALRGEIEKRCEAGDDSTGYRLVTCEGNREVADAELAYDRAKLGKTFLDCVSVSVPKLEAAWLERYAGNGEEKLAEKKARFATAMGDALRRKGSYSKLIRRA